MQTDADETAAYNRPPASNRLTESALKSGELNTAVELGAGDVTGNLHQAFGVSNRRRGVR